MFALAVGAAAAYGGVHLVYGTPVALQIEREVTGPQGSSSSTRRVTVRDGTRIVVDASAGREVEFDVLEVQDSGGVRLGFGEEFADGPGEKLIRPDGSAQFVLEAIHPSAVFEVEVASSAPADP